MEHGFQQQINSRRRPNSDQNMYKSEIPQPPEFPANKSQMPTGNTSFATPPNPFPTSHKKHRGITSGALIAIILCCFLVLAGGITAGALTYQHNQQIAAEAAEKKKKAIEAKKKAEKEAEEEQEAEDAKLSLAYKVCNGKNTNETLQLADEDMTLTYSSTPNSSIDKFDCVITLLQMPQATISKINATTGLSGTQQDSWDNIDVTWSYNGNIGLQAVFQIDDDNDED